MKARANLFRIALQTEFIRRQNEHGKYPLRAFAQSLEMDPSSLHDLMKGERKAGAKPIRRLGEKIGLSDNQIEALLAAEH